MRDASGRVVDGRDGWLSSIAYHVVQDAVAAGTRLAAAELAPTAWTRFESTTNLERPAAHGAGYAPADALICATRHGGRAMRDEGDLGTLEVGMLADMLLVDGDPLKDVSIMADRSKLAMVMKDGAVHSLHEELTA